MLFFFLTLSFLCLNLQDPASLLLDLRAESPDVNSLEVVFGLSFFALPFSHIVLLASPYTYLVAPALVPSSDGNLGARLLEVVFGSSFFAFPFSHIVLLASPYTYLVALALVLSSDGNLGARSLGETA